MKVLPLTTIDIDWPTNALDSWTPLIEKVRTAHGKVGQGDFYRDMYERLKSMAERQRFDGLAQLLSRRVAARALTQLWLDNEIVCRHMLRGKLLTSLVKAQRPRLGRVPLLNLVRLYFQRFDNLDDLSQSLSRQEQDLRVTLETILKEQLALLPNLRTVGEGRDLLDALKRNGVWLLDLQGPKRLADSAVEEDRTLIQVFEDLGLHDFGSGRFGDICYAHYYLDKLHRIPLGQHDEVLDELKDKRVAKASYGDGVVRIGHKALEILIDRSKEHIGEPWQHFILDLAGDPRMASTSPSFRDWWQPLGTARIEKMRGFLSREDLRLFLQAVEQYGNESGKDDLQRMYPARKAFLEGLHRQNRVKSTRLMLGSKAAHSITRILGSDLKTNYIQLNDSQLSDKALIYLDCGDFFLIEGSHSFKLWIYLAKPSSRLSSYDTTRASHLMLTTSVPKSYRQEHPDLPYASITHHPGTWRNNALEFLSENGIELDIESLFTPKDYKDHISRFGLSIVRESRRPGKR